MYRTALFAFRVFRRAFRIGLFAWTDETQIRGVGLTPTPRVRIGDPSPVGLSNKWFSAHVRCKTNKGTYSKFRTPDPNCMHPRLGENAVARVLMKLFR